MSAAPSASGKPAAGKSPRRPRKGAKAKKTAGPASWDELLRLALVACTTDPPTVDAGLPEQARTFIEGLVNNADKRPTLLRALRRQIDSLPYERIHGSWIAHHLPDDPLLRQTCLDLLPPAVRQRVAPWLDDDNARDVMVRTSAAQLAWLKGWWHAHLRLGLAYPVPLPWALDPKLPLTYLDRLEEEHLLQVLALIGLRPLSVGIRLLPRSTVLQVVYGLPPSWRAQLTEWSKKDADRKMEAWRAVLLPLTGIRPPEPEPPPADQAALPEGQTAEGQAAEGKTPDGGASTEGKAASRPEIPLADHSSEPDVLARYLGLLEVAAHAHALGLRDEAVRIAYRLPRDMGQLLRYHVEHPIDGLALKDAEGWHREVQATVERARARGLIEVPTLRADAAS
ncbi:MAG: hypothetical protein AAF899_11730 [Pseudomonadota bacterium]